MIVQDPTTQNPIDVTGWDIDTVYHHAGNVYADRFTGYERPLTDDEIDALALDPTQDWTCGDDDVQARADRLHTITGDARQARDLYGYQVAIADGRATTSAQRFAYDMAVLDGSL